MLRAAAISLVGTVPVAAQAEVWVALAISEHTGATGYGASEESLSAAQDAALEACEDRSFSCRLAIARVDACLTYALDGRTGDWGTGGHADAEIAEAAALDLCASHGATACEVIATRCAPEIVQGN
ncbi:MAG: DUF4189 domain-containing protein [Pseudomonadota bacterium]